MNELINNFKSKQGSIDLLTPEQQSHQIHRIAQTCWYVFWKHEPAWDGHGHLALALDEKLQGSLSLILIR
jgi:hypothetical protein